jgi:hypothetical protein
MTNLSKLVRYLLSGLGIILALGVGAIAKNVVHDLMRSGPADYDSALEVGLTKAEEQIRTTLPRKVDDLTTLVAVSHSGKVFTYTYELSLESLSIEDLNSIKKSTIAQGCASDKVKLSLKIGAVMRYSYQNAAGHPLGSFDVVKGDCA